MKFPWLAHRLLCGPEAVDQHQSEDQELGTPAESIKCAIALCLKNNAHTLIKNTFFGGLP